MKSSITLFKGIWINRKKNHKIRYGERIYSSPVISIIAFLFSLQINVFSQEFFNYQKYLFDPPSTLSLNIEEINKTTGYVRVNGNVTGEPTYISWDWRDGTINDGWFYQEHTYSDLTQNYIVKVTANYSDGGAVEEEVLIRFVAPTVSPITLSEIIPVYVPNNDDVLSTLATRLYTPPATLTYFDDSFFSTIPRATLEYVLSVAAQIQKDFVNDDMYLFDGKFEQYMFRDPTFGGAYSLWFTDPVSFGVGDAFMIADIDYSSMFHEMGHNISLNTPHNFYYGGKIDGYANAIYSESMAQIFQHATGYEIVNKYEDYGLSEDLMFEIKQQVIRTIKFVRDGYEQYILEGKPFASWNDPLTQEDETMWTFLTIAYKFCEHAENSGEGYSLPLQRMMTLLQGLCQEWANSYDQLNDNAAADEFRSTLMVKALSEAFQTDLREEFRDLNFPVSDQIYNALPVELVSFSATAILPNSIKLNWQTATEINNFGFDIERKSLNEWQKIGFVQGNGNSNSPKEYLFTDNKLIGGSKFQYRLKQIDNDGQFEYSDVVEVKLVPTEFALYQNYPNPFNSFTKIRYQLPKESKVVIKIYNVLGAEVMELVNEQKEAGIYEVEFNARNLSSGTFVYRIIADSFVQTRKMILLK
jgi:hypothetical protein